MVGAGCSIEDPTGLKLAGVYSQRIHDELVLEGILEQGECEAPDDLSELASVVAAKTGTQAAVVQRLPRNDFKYAKANEGYRIAAALLREGCLSAIATLNYDLALTDAVRQVDGYEIDEIAGPDDMNYLGSKAIIYLHRNVNEPIEDRWILRKEALDTEWQNSWESVVVSRIAASPVVVFAGLGSPAAVLTKTVGKIREAVPDRLVSFLADPSAESPFAEALDLPAENHVRAFWGEFMRRLSSRVAAQSTRDLLDSCDELCAENGWEDDPDAVRLICQAFGEIGLLDMGQSRATWLCSSKSYEPDIPDTRKLLGDLFLAVGALCGESGRSATFGTGAVLVLEGDGRPPLRVLLVSGAGHRRWSQLDGILANLGLNPDLVLVGAFSDDRPTLAPPIDIIHGGPTDDVASGRAYSQIASVDELRADVGAVLRAVS